MSRCGQRPPTEHQVQLYASAKKCTGCTSNMYYVDLRVPRSKPPHSIFLSLGSKIVEHECADKHQFLMPYFSTSPTCGRAAGIDLCVLWQLMKPSKRRWGYAISKRNHAARKLIHCSHVTTFRRCTIVAPPQSSKTHSLHVYDVMNPHRVFLLRLSDAFDQ